MILLSAREGAYFSKSFAPLVMGGVSRYFSGGIGVRPVDLILPDVTQDPPLAPFSHPFTQAPQFGTHNALRLSVPQALTTLSSGPEGNHRLSEFIAEIIRK